MLLALIACRAPTPPTPLGATAPVAKVVRQPISAGVTHSCARTADGHVWCWGENDRGELGVPGGDRRRPVEVEGLPMVEGVAVGALASCAWTAGGEVWCWGAGDGEGEVVRPAKLVGVDRAAEVRIDSAMACARRLDGSVACWTDSVARPSRIIEIRDVRGEQLVVADERACVRAGDEVTCWTQGDDPAVPQKLAALHGAISIAIDGKVVYGLRPDHRIVNTDAETSVNAPRDARAIVAGTSTLCAIGAGVSCWDTYADKTGTFVPVPTLAGATDVAVGNTHACARTASGAAACWGAAELLGDGRTYEVPPVDVPGLRDVAQIVVDGEHTCVRRTHGTIACWGRRIGDGIEGDAYVNRPTDIAGIDDAIDVALAWFAGCARLRGGDVACWTTARPGPAQVAKVPAFAGATRLLLGATYRCAIVRARVVCDRGALFAALPAGAQDVWTGFQRICARHADGHVRCSHQVVGDSDLGADVTAVGFGLMDTCAVSSRGEVACRAMPSSSAEVTGLPAPAIAVSAATHVEDCALLRDGRVACWAEPGDTGGPRVAKLLAGITDAVEIAGGTFSGCVRHASGTMSCWGVHAFVGDGLGGHITTPVVLSLHL